MTELVTATDIGDCDVFALSGPAKLKADDIADGQKITLYEERVDGGYDPVRQNGNQIELTKSQPSQIVEGYGNYKCLASHSGMVVGYEA